MKENQRVMVYDNNEIITTNNLAQINSSERHYQINMMNNQPQQISTYKSKCPYYCWDIIVIAFTPFCFNCCYNLNCLRDCCNKS